jgi:hypothetical protein
MSVKVFIPQDIVDSWVTADKAELTGEIITFRDLSVALRLVPGFFFGQLVGGSDEAHRLLGRAKVKAAIAAMGAEVYMNSVVLGETAYEVEPGFLAKPLNMACTRADLVAAITKAGF